MSEKVKMTVNMEVTIPQALALQAMFAYWNLLANVGSSRYVSFFVDGDGNFHPKCDVTYDKPIPFLTDELRDLAVVKDNGGDRTYDFDPIAWEINHDD
jgi:hypothetical protein